MGKWSFVKHRGFQGLKFVLVGLTIGSAFFLYQAATYQQGLSVIREGLQTCFGRVNQAFTAKMIGDRASNYLSSSFQGLTEECYGEVLSRWEKTHRIEEGIKTLNRLSNEVHWFHQKLQVAESNESLNERYLKIENMQLKVLATLEAVQTNANQVPKKVFILLAALSLLMALILTLEWFERFKLQRQRELWKHKLSDINSFDQARGLVFEMFTSQGLDAVDELMATLNKNESTSKKVMADGSVDYDFAPKEIMTIAPTPTAALNEVAAVEFAAEKESFHMHEVISTVLDIFSTQIQGQGILLEVDVSDDVWIWGQEEAFTQSLHNLFSFSINCYKHSATEARKISMRSRSVGTTNIFDFVIYGEAFDDEIVKTPLSKLIEENGVGLEISVASELLHDMNGEISLTNALDRKGKTMGKKIKLLLEKVPTAHSSAYSKTKKRTKQIVRGQKQDVLKSLRSLS